MGQPGAGMVGYQRGFKLLFTSVYALDNCKLDRYFDEVQIQYVPPYSCGEEIAALIESGSDRLSLASSFARFAERLTGSADAWTELPRSSVPVQAYEKSMQESDRWAAALHSAKRAGRGWLISTGIMAGGLGILAAVALPAYQDYATRAKLVEGLLVGSDAKPSVGSFFADHGRLPQLAAELAPLQPKGPIGKYIKRISARFLTTSCRP